VVFGQGAFPVQTAPADALIGGRDRRTLRRSPGGRA
jgi:hypothetical protein